MLRLYLVAMSLTKMMSWKYLDLAWMMDLVCFLYIFRRLSGEIYTNIILDIKIWQETVVCGSCWLWKWFTFIRNTESECSILSANYLINSKFKSLGTKYTTIFCSVRRIFGQVGHDIWIFYYIRLRFMFFCILTDRIQLEQSLSFLLSDHCGSGSI